MKYGIILSFSLSILLMITGSAAAQSSRQSCNLGFTFAISNNPNWGENEPIVTGITPGSPADRAGLKINDVILEVNGNGTYLKPHATIASWFAQVNTQMTIAIRNFETSFRTMTIAKDCRDHNAIIEAQLASVYAFYSLEDVQNRRFIMPVKTASNEDAIFSNYHTYDFVPADENTREIDEQINAIIDRALSQRGLKRDTNDPDFIIQTFYSYQNNPLFNAQPEQVAKYQNTWRFDMRNNRMVKLPIFSPSEAVKIDHVAFEVEFGCRFYDRKFMQSGKSTLMWEAEMTERLKSNFGLINYLEINLPLMLMKFPYHSNARQATFEVHHIRYNYTGIGYSINDLKTIVSVDPASPAYYAGIRPGDVITKMQGEKFDYTPRLLTDGYRRFISETMQYRDRNTRYTDNNGFKDCMYWDIAQYANVAQSVADRRYRSVFSYLFAFNQYINWNTPSTISIEVMRNGELLQLKMEPIITKSTNISVI